MKPLLYILHSGNLYGTEQMALATLRELRDEYAVHLYAPAGPVHAAAAAEGIASTCFASPWQLLRTLAPHFIAGEAITVIATGVVHSLIAHTLGSWFGNPMQHLHIVHGGTDERLSYGRKALLDRLPVRLVAVSEFVASRLLAHGCQREHIAIVENFITRQPQRQRPPFQIAGIRRIAVVSRTDPIKRIGLLFDALQLTPELAGLQVDIFGFGSEFAALAERAQTLPGVRLMGYVPDAAERLADYDLLVHTCAEEPFGLALLEAMAAHVPILAPNRGGAGSLVVNCQTGYHFAANDARHLGQVLRQLRREPAARLNAVVAAAAGQLHNRFAPARGIRQYRDLLKEAV